MAGVYDDPKVGAQALADGAGGDGAGGDGAGGEGAGGDGAGGDGAGGDQVVFVTPVAAPPYEVYPWGIDRIGAAGARTTEAGGRLRRFAHMTKAELKEWSEDITQSFEDYVFDLNNITDETKVTEREFREAFRAMRRRRRLNRFGTASARSRGREHGRADLAQIEEMVGVHVGDEYLHFSVHSKASLDVISLHSLSGVE